MFYVIFQNTILKKMAASSSKGRQGSLISVPDPMPKWDDLTAAQKAEILKKTQFDPEPVENEIQLEW